MKELMIELLVDMACAVQNRKNNKINIIMEQCLQDIQCNFAWISLEHLANKYYFNSSYFSTLFKKYTGKHFTNYIMDIRLEKAYRLLLETDKKIYRISKLVGYKDVKYFNKLFKRRYGLTRMSAGNSVKQGIKHMMDRLRRIGAKISLRMKLFLLFLYC